MIWNIGANIISLSLIFGAYSQASAEYLQDVYEDRILLVSAVGNEYDISFSYLVSYATRMSVAAVHTSFDKV